MQNGHVDVVVVGAGILGLAYAYLGAREGKSVAVSLSVIRRPWGPRYGIYSPVRSRSSKSAYAVLRSLIDRKSYGR